MSEPIYETELRIHKDKAELVLRLAFEGIHTETEEHKWNFPKKEIDTISTEEGVRDWVFDKLGGKGKGRPKASKDLHHTTVRVSK